MATTYTKAPSAVLQLIQQVMHKHHPALAFAEVRVGALMARVEDEHGNVVPGAVKLHGYECAATIKKLPVKQRVLGNPDALITIDEGTWKELDSLERHALIDHELTHLQVLRAGGGIVDYDPETETCIGVPKLDAADRPCLRMKLHDWQLGGFESIARRYGIDALEVQALRSIVPVLMDEAGQLRWDFDSLGDGPFRGRGEAA